MDTKRTEYMCTYCGRKTIRYNSAGRPDPGNCPRRDKFRNGKMRPHTWVINRRLS